MGEFSDLARAAKGASQQRFADERAERPTEQERVIAVRNAERDYLMDVVHPILTEAQTEFSELEIVSRIFTSWAMSREPISNFVRLELMPTPLSPAAPNPTQNSVTVTRNFGLTKVAAQLRRGPDSIVCAGEPRAAIHAALRHVLPIYYQIQSRQPPAQR